MERLRSLVFFYTLISFFSEISIAADTISQDQSISDGQKQTLVSSGQIFELGFFSPGNSKNRYLGIWYKNIPNTVVWVANRDNPLTDSSGVLKIANNRNFVLLNQTRSVIWSSNSSTTAVNPVAQLLESGNLVLRDQSIGKSERYLWQSFDYPCDTLVPGMKLGWDSKTSQNWYLTSWKNTDDPSPGDFSYRVDPRGLPQIVLREGSKVEYRTGPWDGIRFSGGPALKGNKAFKPTVIFNEDDSYYYSFQNNYNSVISRFVLNQSGILQHLTWNDERREWVVFVTMQQDKCDEYGLCGVFGSCNINNLPLCKCLKGFTPKFPHEWDMQDASSGCVRRTPLNCSKGEGFLKFKALKLPDGSRFLGNKSMSLEECELECLKNCSCVAYTTTEVRGCVVWFENLIDIRDVSEGGHDLYVRMAASELGNKKKKRVVTIVSVSVVVGMLLLGSVSWCVIWMKRRNKGDYMVNNQLKDYRDVNAEDDDLELPLFDLVTIAAATNNFSFASKIGEGGFGPVYKGVLSTGQVVAVKRLSKDSGQGLKEFKNEVILIAKLQHRNLVRLLGCCIQGEEKMLIYEYMPNRSLDYFIFDKTRTTLLNWQKRFDIIVGTARGLLYLHRDSRLRIIHRDLKAGNILLDNEMNPKISDFGMARTFRGDQTQAQTRMVVGTYGYMSPEYTVDGLFSMKSDVFSFGVLVLEIVSSKKNQGFCHPDHDLNLLGHAWKLWNEGKALKLMDASMEDQLPMYEALRCIQMGLLCVQQRPEDRPTMSSVLLMLDSEGATLPQPKQPGFYTERRLIETDSPSSQKISRTSNEVTITLLEGR